MGISTFKGGVHPYDGKDLAKDQPIRRIKPKEILVYPLSQHIGAPASPIVAVGDTVLRGQKIAEAGGFVSAPVFASVSGTVKAIEPRHVATGDLVNSIIIENDGEMKETDFHGVEDVASLSKEQIIEKVKEAGVVDSGGQGLLEVIKGGYDAFLGKEIDYSSIKPSTSVTVNKVNAEDTADIKFGYCTEFIINLEKPYGEAEEDDLKSFLESIGDSIVCVSLDDIVKIHVHTNHPGQAFEKGLTLGYLTNMKIDNMRIEHHERVIGQAERDEAEKQEEERQHRKQEHKEPRKKYGFITVSMGDGLKTLFEELGADRVIEGGQTMNPSTEDMLNAIDDVNAENIFILPNNKNVVLAANQAATLCEDKNIIVIPTANAPQGISAMIAFDSTVDVDENRSAMKSAVKNVKSGQVTYSVRDTSIDGKAIKEGDIMGIGDKGLVSVGNDIENVTFELIADAVDEDSEVISIYNGADVSEEHAQKLAGRVEEAYPDVDVQCYYGGQPIYYYIVSVE